MMTNVSVETQTLIQKKIRREAQRHGVKTHDLNRALRVLELEAHNQLFDADLIREDITNNTEDLWRAARRVQDFTHDYLATTT